MLYWFAEALRETYGDGPYRLLLSRLVLSALGLGAGAALCWWSLPRVAPCLPRDRGRDHAIAGAASAGKPTSAGIFFIPLLLAIAILVAPFDRSQLLIMGCVLLACWTGHLDDRSLLPWGNYRKALLDLGITVAAALALTQGEPSVLWLPIARDPIELSPWWYVPIATGVLWIAVNATNCTDGVDGLSGSLLLLAFLYLAAILYLVVGHQEVARYLLVPFVTRGADWGILAFTTMGVLLGYLWHNANPSSVLMGDAGSRALGLLLGVLVLATGNPFLILIVAGVVLVNGGTGLVKVALLRFFKIGIFRSIRFPLHDHCRKALNWSNAQVLVRFMILQALLAPLLIVLLLKVR